MVQEVKDAVVDLLYKNPTVANQIIERVVFNEKLRKELSAVKKEAKEKQKKISFKILVERFKVHIGRPSREEYGYLFN